MRSANTSIEASPRFALAGMFRIPLLFLRCTFLVIGFSLINLGLFVNLTSFPAFAQLPNKKLTPGAVRTTDAKAICSASFTTRDERHTTAAMKRQVCQAYGIKNCPNAKVMELDHACPLELGGADEIGNLWVQFAKYKDGSPGYHQKDALENRLHKLVCSGKMSLKDAQSCILTDWIVCYKKVMVPSSRLPGR